MCRSTLENNFSNGNPGIGAGINTGILYLLVLPYLAVLVLGVSAPIVVPARSFLIPPATSRNLTG
jgi:hypothetical protein